MSRILVGLVVGLTLAAGSSTVAVAQTTTSGGQKKPAPPAPQKPAAKAPATSPAKFDAIATKADEARQAGRLDEAVELYRQALAIKPEWPEGLWAFGTALYELDRFADARDAFRRLLVKHGENGTAWALKGLCEFRLKNYDA